MGRTFFSALRTGLGVTVVGLATIVLGLVAVTVALVRPRNRFVDRVIIRSWARIFNWATGIRLEVEGENNIEEGRGYVFVSNHASDADIASSVIACRNPIRFLAKKELFRVPFLGFYLKRLGFIKVDRDAGRATLGSVNEQVANAVTMGRSLMIYPEGTRSRDGSLHAFKKGAFRIAIDNGLDVIPMAMSGSYEAWPPGSKIIYGGRVKVTIGEPISVAGMTTADIERLRDEAYKVVASNLAQS